MGLSSLSWFYLHSLGLHMRGWSHNSMKTWLRCCKGMCPSVLRYPGLGSASIPPDSSNFQPGGNRLEIYIRLDVGLLCETGWKFTSGWMSVFYAKPAGDCLSLSCRSIYDLVPIWSSDPDMLILSLRRIYTYTGYRTARAPSVTLGTTSLELKRQETCYHLKARK